MVRRAVYFFLMLSLLLAGCAGAHTETPAAPAETTAPTVPVQTLPTIETAAPTESAVPYLLRIERNDQSIHEGPSYDDIFVATVGEKGVYTIVEEATDAEGNLWGRLKSGIGWVDLTEIQSGNYASSFLSANYADENLMLHGAYHHYSDQQEHRIPIAIYAYETLYDVALFDMVFETEGFVAGEDLIKLPEMTEEMPLVAELDFPGDMSTYGIRFVDAAGITHVYSIYISGRNGALILAEGII